jgi:hypothetical protein
MKLANDGIANNLSPITYFSSAPFTVASITVNGTFLGDNWSRPYGNLASYGRTTEINSGATMQSALR